MAFIQCNMQPILFLQKSWMNIKSKMILILSILWRLEVTSLNILIPLWIIKGRGSSFVVQMHIKLKTSNKIHYGWERLIAKWIYRAHKCGSLTGTTKTILHVSLSHCYFQFCSVFVIFVYFLFSFCQREKLESANCMQCKYTLCSNLLGTEDLKWNNIS